MVRQQKWVLEQAKTVATAVETAKFEGSRRLQGLRAVVQRKTAVA